MKTIALFGITAYQRHLSPRKGFCCAYRTWTGRRSCSTFGYRAIRRHGVWSGVMALRRRFARCADAMRALRSLPAGSDRQRGFCDIDCLPGCDLPFLDCAGAALDVLACSDLPGDCGDWGRRKRKSEPEMVDATQQSTAAHR